MIDIVLIHSPIILYESQEEKDLYLSHGGDEKSYYPLNILYLASTLEKNGHSVKVMDISAEGLTLSQVIKRVQELNPMLIGISSMTTGIQSAVKLGETFKKLGFIVGIGGTHVCCDQTFIDRYPLFDFCVIGEGEITLEKIVTKIKKGEKIQKLYFGETCQNLDDLPFPSRHLINTDIYKRDEQMTFEVPAAGMLSSRGCPYNCIFCCIPGRSGRVRFRSAKNIVKEMEEIYDQCQGQYSFVDDCFTTDRKRVIDLCKQIIRRNLQVSWIASTRADRVDKELIYWMAWAGCKELYFGVESGNDRIRNEVIGKRLAESEIKEAIRLCRNHKIMSNLFLMLGFPTETEEEIKDTIEIGNRVGADAIGIHITMTMPGSEMYDIAIKEGKLSPDNIDKFIKGKKGFRGTHLYVPNGLTLEQMIEFKKQAYRRFYLSPKFMLRRLKVWWNIPGRFKADLKLFKIAPYILKHGQSKGQLS